MPAIPEDLLDFELRPGDEIHFCLNMSSAIAEFDRAVANAIADSLLVTAEIFDMVDVHPPLPLDYIFGLSPPELFLVVTNECDAIMGWPVPRTGTMPEWLTITAAYYEAPVLLAVRGTEGLQPGDVIGTRLGTPADSQWRVLTQSTRTYGRLLFSNYQRMIDALENGDVDGILIWEPGLRLATGGDLAAAGMSVVTPPVPLAPVRFGVALPRNETYLRGLIDGAIAALVADGVITDIARQFGLTE
ncbi:MAG: transporter substrate-binding domain-containing protein [Bauldia sp.]|nr:transporter substrate-binding domain-containing protein [Bauldia sp.]